jgi:hypothetical protein
VEKGEKREKFQVLDSAGSWDLRCSIVFVHPARRASPRSDSGFVATLGLEMDILGENPQNLKEDSMEWETKNSDSENLTKCGN